MVDSLQGADDTADGEGTATSRHEAASDFRFVGRFADLAANMPKVNSAGLLAGLAGVNAAGPLVNFPKMESLGLWASAAGSLANLPKMDSAGLLAGLAGVNAAGPLVNFPKMESLGLWASAAGSLANLPKMDSAGLLAGLAGVNAAGPLVNLPKVDSVGLLANMPPVNTVELMMKFAGPIRTSHLFADLYAPSAIAKLNTEKLTRGLGPRNLAVGLRVAEALAGIDGNKILDEHAGHSASDLSVELAAPQNATAVVGALSDLTADVSDRSELEILDLLGARAAEALARFGDMFATTLRGITFRSSQRYIALALLAELQLIMFISDRNLFEYISDHFGFQANILAVWLFLRAGKRS